jgi:branched-chain amino acid transport system permease protein
MKSENRLGSRIFSYLGKALLVSVWFVVLTFPITVIKVNTVDNKIEWRLASMIAVAVVFFFLSIAWQYLMEKKDKGLAVIPKSIGKYFTSLRESARKIYSGGAYKKITYPSITGILVALPFVLLAFPQINPTYHTNIIITSLMYVVLGLGLNIIVGFGGLLNLAYAAFYAVGAYTYALLYKHFGINFWIALPLGGIFAAFLGIIIGLPVLRLRGDYLAIVTLAFGEIVRIVLENWNEFSAGPSGIANIPKPGLFGISLDLGGSTIYLYYIVLALTAFTIFIVGRLEDSRIGRSWVALREDEVACQAMGIDTTRSKISLFAISSFFAGLMGVVFAAKTGFVNPASFTLWDSINVLLIVVLGGMGSIPGVILGAFIIITLKYYLGTFGEYWPLIYGAALVLMMIFKPDGLINRTVSSPSRGRSTRSRKPKSPRSSSKRKRKRCR